MDFDFGFWGWLIVADRVFGPHTASQEVYDVAAKPVVKAAMEGVNGMHYFLDHQKLLYCFIYKQCVQI